MNFDYISFLDELTEKVEELKIDLVGAKLDHIAYQAATTEEYGKLKSEFSQIATLVREPIVNGRRVAVFKYNTPQSYNDQQFEAMELIEPHKDENPPSAFEHAEYLLSIPLEDFINKYPNINWNTENLNRKEFPMLKLKLADDMQVKFPRNSVLA